MNINQTFSLQQALILSFFLAFFTFNLAFAQTYTLCEGEEITIGPFRDAPSGPTGAQGSYPCPQWRTITPQTGVISSTFTGFIVSPSSTTDYTIVTSKARNSPNACTEGGEVIEMVTVIVETCNPGSSLENPYIIQSCPGEQVTLNGFDVDVPPPPLGVIDDVGGPDFRFVDYYIDGPNGNICQDCTSGEVSPQTSTHYTITWENHETGLPRDRSMGTRYFLVEVQNCPTEVDLIAPNNSPDIKFTVSPTERSNEGTTDINVDFYNNGPGYVESVDFLWEINGVVEDITSYNGASILAGNTVTAILPNYFFEAETAYTIKVTATNINDGVDLTPLDNVYEYIIPAFEAAPDLIIEITAPVNPIMGSGDIVVDISNVGNAYVYNFIINWTVNGALQSPLMVDNAAWNPNWPNAGSLSYKIGSRGFNPNNDYEIEAWIELLDGEEDVNLTNNRTTFNYLAKNSIYYTADETLTICEGESITLSQSTIYFDKHCYVCRARLINPVWTLGSETLNITDTEITITPTESGFYDFNSDTDTDTFEECDDNCEENEVDGFTVAPYGPHSYQYGIIVLPCEEPETLGCTDSKAYNYNPEATVDDDSCIYPDLIYTMCKGNQVEIGPFSKLPSPPGNCFINDAEFFVRNIIPSEGVISKTGDYYVVAPTETTVYRIITSPPPVGPGYGEYCNLPNSIEEIVVVEVVNCEETTYFNKDITICSRDTVLLSNFIVPPLPPNYEGQIIPFCADLQYSIEPDFGVVSNNSDSFEVAPSETTTYIVTIEYAQLDSSSVCMPTNTREEFITIYVEECEPCVSGSSPDCPTLFDDYTICHGDSVETIVFPHPLDAVDSPDLPACTTVIGDINPQYGVVSKNYDTNNHISYVLAPATTTTYTFTTYYGSSSNSPSCHPGETYSVSFTVFVEECEPCVSGSSPDCPTLFDDYTICHGDSVETIVFPHPLDAVDSPDLPACTTLIGDISPQNGVVSKNYDDFNHISYVLAPTTTTTYTFTTYFGASANSPSCHPGETFSVSFTVFVEECEPCVSGSSPDCPTFFDDYTICQGNSVETIAFPHPLDAVDSPDLSACTTLIGDINPQNGVVSKNYDDSNHISYVLAPATTTTYTFTTYYGSSLNSPSCHPGETFSVSFTVFVEECEPCEPGSSPDCPYVIETCPGQRVLLNGSLVGAPPPPIIVVLDVGTPDFSNVNYQIDGPDGNVCVDCGFAYVSPQTTSLYSIFWDNYLYPYPIGDGYFLVKVQDCPTETDLVAPYESPDIKFTVKPTELTREGVQTISVDFYNDGPGYIESADFDWEINGINEGTTSYNGPSILTGESISAIISNYFFEAGTNYTIKVTATNVNGVPDLNPSNNVYEFSLPAFDAAPDLGIKIIEPVNPINNGVGEVKVSIISSGLSYANDFVINWSVNGVLQSPYTVNDAEWNSLPPTNAAVLYSIGSVNFNIDHDYEIKAWVELINNSIEDIDLTNDSTTFYYFANDRAYYSADEVITICKGETITIGKSYFVYDEGCWICYSTPNNPSWTLNNDTIGTDREITISPTESGLYYLYSDVTTDCYSDFCVPGPGMPNPNFPIGAEPNPPVGAEPYKATFVERYYGIIVIPCNDTELIGCTDACAPNYNPEATDDDGSCMAYDTCLEDNCFSKYTWNAETCNCTEKIIDYANCNDDNDCTLDYIGSETCECVNEPIPDCRNSCNNEPGLMQTASTFVCNGNAIYTHEIFSVIDENSVKAFIFHKEKSFNGEDYILMQEGSRFVSPGQNYHNKPVYISAVIGPPGIDGLPKLDDDCTVWTPKGANLVFFDPITLTIENERCEMGQYFVDISVNGGVAGISADFAYAVISDGNREYQNVHAGDIKTFGPYEGKGNYLIEVTDAKGCSLNFTNTYNCSGQYQVLNPSIKNACYVIAHTNPNAKIKSVNTYSISGQVVKSNASINGSSCEVDILSNKGMYLVELLLSNDKVDYIKVIK